MTRASPPTSMRLRFVLPSASRKMRRSATLSANASAVAGPPACPPPPKATRPGPGAPRPQPHAPPAPALAVAERGDQDRLHAGRLHPPRQLLRLGPAELGHHAPLPRRPGVEAVVGAPTPFLHQAADELHFARRVVAARGEGRAADA